jgi:hypothetical protein
LNGLGRVCGRAEHISLCQFQAGEKDPSRSEGVKAFHLSRQLKASLAVLLSGIQIIPLVVYAHKAKICFTGHRIRRIIC